MKAAMSKDIPRLHQKVGRAECTQPRVAIQPEAAKRRE